MQGGPHNHTISGLACALKQAAGSDFKAYQEQVLKNSAALAEGLKKRGFTLVSGGRQPSHAIFSPSTRIYLTSLVSCWSTLQGLYHVVFGPLPWRGHQNLRRLLMYLLTSLGNQRCMPILHTHALR